MDAINHTYDNEVYLNNSTIYNTSTLDSFSLTNNHEPYIETEDILFSTDLHSHLSGVLPGTSLLKLAASLDKDIFIPSTWLKSKFLTDFDYTESYVSTEFLDQKVQSIFAWIPNNQYVISIKTLTTSDKMKLLGLLEIRKGVTSFSELQDVYYNRELINVQVPYLNYLESVFAEYNANKVKFVSLSTVKLIDSDFQNLFENNINDLEKKYEINSEFLFAIQRTSTYESILQKYKYIADTLFNYDKIMGIDFIGEEAECFSTHTYNIIDFFVNKFINSIHGKCQLVIRVHAGESPACHENLYNILKYLNNIENILIRIGHGNFGVDDKTLKLMHELSLKRQLIIEINPTSNVALGYIDNVNATWPIIEYIKYDIPFVLGSDGYGIYGVDFYQIFNSLKQNIYVQQNNKIIINHIKNTELQYISWYQESLNCRKQYV